MPERIANYVILQRLGQGGMGELYLARDSRLDRHVALKFLPRDVENDPDARARFVAEARAAAAIDHPYICKIYETGEAVDGTAFIAMEFVEGTSLASRMAGGGMPVGEAVRICSEIAEALAKAHERGIVHRDLKPSNVMLTPDGHVKVVDFGIAKRMLDVDDETAAGLTRTGEMVGTLRYMSPEQACGRIVDARTDIFSLGLILSEMVSGQHPFERPSAMETALAIVRDDPYPLASSQGPLPPPLPPIVARMLHKEAAGRYQSAGDVALDLRTLTAPSETGRAGAAGPAASIAVLPLVNRTGAEADEYFTDGMTEEIIIRLSKTAGLKVISLGTMMRFKGTEKTARDIGRELGVDTVLEGSVRRGGPRLRVSVGLTDTATLTQLWAEIYDRDAGDIFAMQTDIAEEIGRTLKERFPSLEMRSSVPPESPASVEVYHLYLKGWHASMRMTPDALQQGWRYFRRALELDPAYARCYAALAITHARAGNYGYLPPADAFSQARAAARQAVQLDPQLPDGHVASALIALYYDWDWPAAESAFLRALKLNPNSADAHMFYSVCLVTAGRSAQAVREARRALEVDPLSTMAGANLAYVLSFAERHDEALAQIQQTLLHDPDHLPAKAMLASIYLDVGRYDEAIALLQQWSWTRAHLGWAYAMAGRRDDARVVLAHLLEQPRRGTFDLALLCLFLGDAEQGLQWLEKAIDERDNKMYGFRRLLAIHPFLERYRDDVRMQALVRRIAPSGTAPTAEPAI